jgi:hypothetical protein
MPRIHNRPEPDFEVEEYGAKYDFKGYFLVCAVLDTIMRLPQRFCARGKST